MSIPQKPFIFVRHGQTDWNAEGRLQGHTDVPLNATGLEQATAICKSLLVEHVDYIISSPLIRALKTAATIAETHSKPIHIDSRLKERTFGSFEGQLTSEVKRQHGIPPEQSVTSILPPDAEQWPQTCARITAVVTDWMTLHPRSRLVFVGHGATMRALAEVLTGTRFEAENARAYLFTPTSEAWQITLL